MALDLLFAWNLTWWTIGQIRIDSKKSIDVQHLSVNFAGCIDGCGDKTTLINITQLLATPTAGRKYTTLSPGRCHTFDFEFKIPADDRLPSFANVCPREHIMSSTMADTRFDFYRFQKWPKSPTWSQQRRKSPCSNYHTLYQQQHKKSSYWTWSMCYYLTTDCLSRWARTWALSMAVSCRNGAWTCPNQLSTEASRSGSSARFIISQPCKSQRPSR